jgi:hypothetical protein
VKFVVSVLHSFCYLYFVTVGNEFSCDSIVLLSYSGVFIGVHIRMENYFVTRIKIVCAWLFISE